MKRMTEEENTELKKLNSELFCTGDDDYKPNIGYVIGLSKNKLYSHVMDKYGVIYVECAHHACTYEHFTDAKIGIHGLYKDGIEEAKDYKVYKAICELQECENYENDEGGVK